MAVRSCCKSGERLHMQVGSYECCCGALMMLVGALIVLVRMFLTVRIHPPAAQHGLHGLIKGTKTQ